MLDVEFTDLLLYYFTELLAILLFEIGLKKCIIICQVQNIKTHVIFHITPSARVTGHVNDTKSRMHVVADLRWINHLGAIVILVTYILYYYI